MKITVLMGMKHSGKSTLGKLLGKNLGVGFWDSDTEVEALAKEKWGRSLSVREIFNERGFSAFQALETEAVGRITGRLRHDSTLTAPNGVLSLGGGTIENAEALFLLADLGHFIYLDEDEAVLFQRILKRGLPPFLQGTDPEKRFHELYKKRTPLYAARADYVLNMRNLNPMEALQKVLRHLKGES